MGWCGVNQGESQIGIFPVPRIESVFEDSTQ